MKINDGGGSLFVVMVKNKKNVFLLKGRGHGTTTF